MHNACVLLCDCGTVCCAVLCCAVLCCAVLCCAVLCCAGDGAVPLPLPLYLLGLDIQERWTFAVDITAARELFMVCGAQCTARFQAPAAPAAHMLPDSGSTSSSSKTMAAGDAHGLASSSSTSSTCIGRAKQHRHGSEGLKHKDSDHVISFVVTSLAQGLNTGPPLPCIPLSPRTCLLVSSPPPPHAPRTSCAVGVTWRCP
jgi:hypothetical protein